MSKHWKPRKQTVELQPQPRVSRIRRDPPRAEKKVEPLSREWEIRLAIAGIILFALAITFVTVGFSAITGRGGGGAAAVETERFGSCDGRPNCVIDADTIRLAGETVAIAGMQVPQIDGARCPEEQRRGAKAAQALAALLNNGKVTIGAAVRGSDGEWRRTVLVDGRDLAATMIAQRLAREDGSESGWC